MAKGVVYWVETSFFPIEPGEDVETNPGCYGRAMARWIADKLREQGQPIEEVFGEDWGWCIMLSWRPFPLWIGCGNRFGNTGEWCAFVEAEPSIFQRLLGSPDAGVAVERVSRILEAVLREVPGTTKAWTEEKAG